MVVGWINAPLLEVLSEKFPSSKADTAQPLERINQSSSFKVSSDLKNTTHMAVKSD